MEPRHFDAPTSPEGHEIIGTVEKLEATCYVRWDEEGPGLEYTGEIPATADEGEQIRRLGELVWADSAGLEWRTSEIDWKGRYIKDIDPEHPSLRVETVTLVQDEPAAPVPDPRPMIAIHAGDVLQRRTYKALKGGTDIWKDYATVQGREDYESAVRMHEREGYGLPDDWRFSLREKGKDPFTFVPIQPTRYVSADAFPARQARQLGEQVGRRLALPEPHVVERAGAMMDEYDRLVGPPPPEPIDFPPPNPHERHIVFTRAGSEPDVITITGHDPDGIAERVESFSRDIREEGGTVSLVTLDREEAFDRAKLLREGSVGIRAWDVLQQRDLTGKWRDYATLQERDDYDRCLRFVGPALDRWRFALRAERPYRPAAEFAPVAPTHYEAS